MLGEEGFSGSPAVTHLDPPSTLPVMVILDDSVSLPQLHGLVVCLVCGFLWREDHFLLALFCTFQRVVSDSLPFLFRMSELIKYITSKGTNRKWPTDRKASTQAPGHPAETSLGVEAASGCSQLNFLAMDDLPMAQFFYCRHLYVPGWKRNSCWTWFTWALLRGTVFLLLNVLLSSFLPVTGLGGVSPSPERKP